MKRARQNGHRHTCDCGKRIRAGGPWTMHTRTCDTYREAERKREVARLVRSTERLARKRYPCPGPVPPQTDEFDRSDGRPFEGFEWSTGEHCSIGGSDMEPGPFYVPDLHEAVGKVKGGALTVKHGDDIYAVPVPSDGKWHEVRVSVTDSGVTARVDGKDVKAERR